MIRRPNLSLALIASTIVLALAGAALMVALGGCINQPTVPQTPQEAINEANITLTATATVIGQNVKDGIFTKDEAQRYVDKVRELGGQLDQAQALVKSGMPDAKSRAELVRSLILALHREVATRARVKP
jgi:polyhydroxyalkanoate synthesis regulator phasin